MTTKRRLFSLLAISVVLGCGLFAAAFFSAKSGVDEQVTDSTCKERERTEGSSAAGAR